MVNITEQRTTANASKLKTVMIIYDEPKIVVVRQYTRSFIPRVDPKAYNEKYENTLLDTATLLAITQRLNIDENAVSFKHISF